MHERNRTDMKYSTIFIDLDDTLIDTLGDSLVNLRGLYNDYNLHRYFATVDDFLHVYSDNSRQLWGKYNKGEIDKDTLIKERFRNPFRNFADVDTDFLETMNTDFLGRMVRRPNHIDGAIEILEHLKPRYSIVVISNGFSELQYHKIENAGLSPYIDKVILSDEVGVNKPHPAIFEFALRSSEIDARSAVMVGDNIHTDISGAMNSNIDQLWFNPQKEEADIRPTYTISALCEIKQIL